MNNKVKGVTNDGVSRGNDVDGAQSNQEKGPSQGVKRAITSHMEGKI